MNPRTGFTLIELLAVVAILSIAVGVVAVQIRSPLVNARRGAWVSACRSLDQTARARGCCVLRIDQNAGEMSLNADVSRDIESVTFPLRVPESAFIHEVLGATSTQDGTHAVPIDRWGSSKSYAICIRSRKDSSDRWLVVLGMIGQSYVLEDRASVVSILGMEGRNR